MRLSMNDLMSNPLKVRTYPKLWQMFRPRGKIVQINFRATADNNYTVQLGLKFKEGAPGIRVFAGTKYMGRIVNEGEYHSVANQCDPLWNAVVNLLDKLDADPIKTVADYGIESGLCGFCSRALTDPESIKFGIGPICRRNVG